MAFDRRSNLGGWRRQCLALWAAAWMLLGLGTASAQDDAPPSTTSVGLDEKIGQKVPGAAAFYDEHGARRTLAEAIDRPTILVLVFFHCPGICGTIQSNLAHALKSVPDKLGEDYRVLTVSFDDEESSDLALEAKANYMRIIGDDVGDAAWRFMTGDAENIQRVTGAVGFKFMKNGTHDYTHPALITVLAADGKIIRYLYGMDYLPMELSMALSEASRGTPGVSIKKMVSYCFAYDSKSQRYAFRFFRIFGVIMVTLVGGFLFFLLRRGREDAPGDKA
jgi:protein SCO1/2